MLLAFNSNLHLIIFCTPLVKRSRKLACILNKSVIKYMDNELALNARIIVTCLDRHHIPILDQTPNSPDPKLFERFFHYSKVSRTRFKIEYLENSVFKIFICLYKFPYNITDSHRNH